MKEVIDGQFHIPIGSVKFFGNSQVRKKEFEDSAPKIYLYLYHMEYQLSGWFVIWMPNK